MYIKKFYKGYNLTETKNETIDPRDLGHVNGDNIITKYR